MYNEVARALVYTLLLVDNEVARALLYTLFLLLSAHPYCQDGSLSHTNARGFESFFFLP